MGLPELGAWILYGYSQQYIPREQFQLAYNLKLSSSSEWHAQGNCERDGTDKKDNAQWVICTNKRQPALSASVGVAVGELDVHLYSPTDGCLKVLKDRVSHRERELNKRSEHGPAVGAGHIGSEGDGLWCRLWGVVVVKGEYRPHLAVVSCKVTQGDTI